MSIPPRLEAVAARSFEPQLARQGLKRLPSHILDSLEADDILAERVITTFASSRSLALAVARQPETLNVLQEASYALPFESPTNLDLLRSHLTAGSPTAEDPRCALRRFKHAELFRIATRDLTRTAPLEVIAAEVADLASICLEGALAIARKELGDLDIPFTIIGMGKLGGLELNYSSDVDVMFVHDGDLDQAQRLARQIIQVMQEPLPDGIVFRTDADLRPEGRAGALSRTIDGYLAYYERWAEAWEYQALLKAGITAGDPTLGKQFSEMIGTLLWNAPLPNDALRTLRHMKSRSEQQNTTTGHGDRNVKLGAGGIRDIEFAIQMLQLVHGRSDSTLRSPTTLHALEALREGQYLTHTDASTFRVAYLFLREVEHRVQLVDEAQTHDIPADDEAREHLARTMGYTDHGTDRAVAQFDRYHAQLRSQVRAAHERAYFAPLLDALVGRESLGHQPVEERLAAFGFTDTNATKAAISELTPGISRSAAIMQQYLPLLLEWLSISPDPNRGLLGLRRLLDGPVRRSAVISTFRESPLAAERTCQLLGSSRFIRDALRRHPEAIRILGDDVWLATPLTVEELIAEATSSIEWRADIDAQRDGLRRFKRRKLLDIAIRDVIGREPVRTVGAEISALGEACLTAAMSLHEVPLAVVAMGRLGGAELSYASDLDVMFVYEGSGATAYEQAERAATRLLRDIGAPTTEGETFHIDADIRPEGKKGSLALSLEGFRDYYEHRAEPWEHLALLKARVVGGNRGVGERFIEMVQKYRYPEAVSTETIRSIQRIKLRVEKERLPSGVDPELHLKLGRGTISDVEFTVQLLQLQYAHDIPALQTPSTYEALAALKETDLLPPSDTEVLLQAFSICQTIRNATTLAYGSDRNTFPGEAEAAAVAQLCGYTSAGALREEYRRRVRRSRAVMERSFFGIDAQPA